MCVCSLHKYVTYLTIWNTFGVSFLHSPEKLHFHMSKASQIFTPRNHFTIKHKHCLMPYK